MEMHTTDPSRFADFYGLLPIFMDYYVWKAIILSQGFLSNQLYPEHFVLLT